jgi:hypothetical protein
MFEADSSKCGLPADGDACTQTFPMSKRIAYGRGSRYCHISQQFTMMLDSASLRELWRLKYFG